MNYFKAILLLTSLPLLYSCGSSSSKAMTFNIRYDNPNDGDNWWNHRKTEVASLVLKYDPDFLGLQEALPSQIAFLTQQLDAYKFIGEERDGKGSNSEGAPIFYKHNKYEVTRKETIWLSETPEVISKGWDAALNRIVTYGVFKNKSSDQLLHVFNAHFDHRGEVARQQSAALLVNYITENNLSDQEIVLMGDFNAIPTDVPIQTLISSFEDSFDKRDVPATDPIGTFNGFDTTKVADRRIDYIFTKNISVKRYQCIDDRRENGLHVSDHHAIVMEF